jgi:hypothetical protein
MRRAAFLLLLSLAAADARAQAPGPVTADPEWGGCFGPVIRYTSLYNHHAAMLGLRGGWRVGESLTLGAGAHTLMTKVGAPEGVMPVEGPLDIDLTTFGIEAEYVVSRRPWGHIGLFAMAGGGASRYVKDTDSTWKSTEQTGETDFLWVVEPGLTAEWRAVRWLRLNAGISYRLVTNVEMEGLSNGDLSGVAASLTFKTNF